RQLLATGNGPRLAAVVGALHDLPEPTARLRRVNPVGINGRSLHVINLPAAEVRAGDFPVLARAVRGEDERAFFRSDQDSYFAHFNFLLRGWVSLASPAWDDTRPGTPMRDKVPRLRRRWPGRYSPARERCGTS